MKHCITIMLLAALFAAAGCGGSRSLKGVYPVSGVITHQGQPLGDVVIQLVPVVKTETSRAGSAVSAPDGKFVITTLSPGDGVYAGDYKVTLTKFACSITKEQSDEFLKITGTEANAENLSILPAKYQTAAASPLEFTVKKGKNELRIDVPEELIEAKFPPSLSYEAQMERWKKRNNK